MSKSCIRCAAEGREIELTRNDEPIGVGVLCDSCFGKALERYYELQRQFNELIAAGVSNEKANEIMIARIENQVDQA